MQFHARHALTPLILPLVLTACSHAEPSPPPTPAAVVDHGVIRVPPDSPLRTRLKVRAVALQELSHGLSAPAIVEADPAHTVNVVAPLTGRIVELDVRLGDRVTRGQVLAVMASGDFAQAVTDLQKATDALALAKATLDRAEGVQQAGGAARKDLEVARSAFIQARAEHDRAQARLDAVGSDAIPHGNARRMTLVSPTDGSITALSAAQGGFVNDASSALMTITDLSHVWVTADVAESEAAEITPGLSADIVFPGLPGRHAQGTVQSVSDVLDADSRRVKARIAVSNADGALKANMFATATFQVPQPKALFVPQSALLMNNDDVTVFVEVSPWAFRRRTVVPGSDEGDQTRILKGLQPGDRVVVAGGVLIND